MRWPAERDAELRDGLLVLLEVAVRAPRLPGVPQVPDVVVELFDDLSRNAMSDPGRRSVEQPRLDEVTRNGQSPTQVGRVLGVSGRQVRRWCAADLVAHEIDGDGRYWVDLDDARRHHDGRAR